MPPRRQAKPRSVNHAALGRAVEELRLEAELTQQTLADRDHSEFRQIGFLERGLSNPTFDSLVRVARGLGVELSVLISRYERILREFEKS